MAANVSNNEKARNLFMWIRRAVRKTSGEVVRPEKSFSRQLSKVLDTSDAHSLLKPAAYSPIK